MSAVEPLEPPPVVSARPSAGRETSRSPVLSRAAWWILVLVPGALSVYFAFRSGGYFPGPQGFITGELALLIAARFLLAKQPAPNVNGLWLVAVAALTALAGWTLLSGEHSGARGRAEVEATLVLLYLAALGLFGCMSRPLDALRWTVRGLALAGVIVCGAAIVSLTLPATLPIEPGAVHPEQLSYPLSYWNSLGLFAGLSLIYCGWLTTSTHEGPWARVFGAMAVPLLLTTLYYTYSRGATGATLLGLAIYAILARPRGLPGALIATVAPALVALMRVHPGGPLVYGDRGSSFVQGIGRETAMVIFGCMLAAGIIRFLALPLDRRLHRIRLAPRLRRILLVGGAAVLLATAAGAAVALDVPRQANEKVHQFLQDERVAGAAGGSRFFNAGANGRIEQWNIALDASREDRWRGGGAGTFPLYWQRTRETSLHVQNAHSLYFEMLAELGIPGLALATLVLLLMLWGFAIRLRRLDRCLSACLTAALLAWAIRAAVDWDWEMPATTLGLFAAGGLALVAGRRHESRRWRWPARGAVILGALGLALVPGMIGISEARLSDARAAVAHGDCGSALEAATRAAVLADSRAEPHYLVGFCHIEEGQPRRAISAMQRAIRRDPANWRYWIGLAVAQARAGRGGRRAALAGYRLNPRTELAADAAKRAREGRRSLADAAIAMP